MEALQCPHEVDDPSLDDVRMPPSLRGAYVLVLTSFVSGLATLSVLMTIAIFGVWVGAVLLFAFPLLGAAMACGAVVAGLQELKTGSRHAPLAAFVVVLGVLEAVGWLLMCLLPAWLVL